MKVLQPTEGTYLRETLVTCLHAHSFSIMYSMFLIKDGGASVLELTGTDVLYITSDISQDTKSCKMCPINTCFPANIW